MNTETINSIRDLGIAIVAVMVMGYIIFLLIKELRDNRVDYRDFVTDNNHESIVLIKEQTATLVEVRNSITVHTNAIQHLIDKLDK